MRSVPAAFQTHLDGKDLRVCYVWIITRRDEARLGFTDHDRPIEFGGLSCSPSGGFSPFEVDQSLGAAGGQGAVSGYFRDERISAQDIHDGLYAEAQIDTFRVQWDAPENYVHISRGFLADLRQAGESFEAEWTGLASRLDRSTGRVFARRCDAAFADARCGLDADDFLPGTACARTFAACQGFGNTVNFRGFPYILGDDALIAAPREGEIRDGGSRYGS